MLALQCQLGSAAAERDVEGMAPQIGFILSEAAASSLITKSQQVTRLLCWKEGPYYVAFLHPLCRIHQVRRRFHHPVNVLIIITSAFAVRSQ